jgi:uncharacterized membrane protein
MLRQLLLFLHLISAMAWLGGMFFAYFCLRPAAVEVLDPPKRLPLWVATFARFLPYMTVAVLLLLGTGLAMLLPVGFGQAPGGWHAMLALGLVMAAVFAYVYWVLFPKLRADCSATAWPAAAQTLNRIRQLVALNLWLGVLVVAAAVSAR